MAFFTMSKWSWSQVFHETILGVPKSGWFDLGRSTYLLPNEGPGDSSPAALKRVAGPCPDLAKDQSPVTRHRCWSHHSGVLASLNCHGQPFACDAWKWWRKGGVQGGISKTCTNLPIEFEMETNEDRMKLGKEARMICAGVSCQKMHTYKSYACFKIRWPLKKIPNLSKCFV